MKTLTKYWVNGLLGMGIAVWGGAAWGQTPALQQHATASQNCVVFVANSLAEVRNFQWSGVCENGFANGRGVLVWQNFDSYRKRWDNRWAGAGEMRAGRRVNWWLAPNRIEKGVLAELFEDGSRKSFKSFNDPNKPAVAGYPQATVQALTDWIGSGGARTDSLPFSYLIAALDAYYKDETAFLEGRITGDFGSSRPSGSKQTPTSSTGDDPKVFGRGVRGG